jgi:hypothetical protein
MKQPLINETKTDCKVMVDGKTLDALIHLMEIRYGDKYTFWNAVLQMTDENFKKVGKSARQMTPELVELQLPDGRTGFLLITHWEAVSAEPPVLAGYSELAGVGKPNPE